MSICSVTHQVVSGLLLGAVEVVQRDAQGVGAQHAVAAAAHTQPVQGPEQRAGLQTQPRGQRAGGRQAGADRQHGVLRGDHCHI